MSVRKAWVLKIGDRYFCRISKTNRVMTAWSLAGAKTYLPSMGYVYPDIKKLTEKHKKKVHIIEIGVM